MKRFSYPLQRVLEVRNLRRLLAEEAFSQSLQNARRAQSELGDSMRRRQDLQESIRKASLGTPDISCIRHLLKYRLWVEDEVLRWEEELARRQALMGERRQEVLERTRDYRALDNHREDSRRNHARRVLWEEGKNLDEMAVMRSERQEGR